MHLIDDGVALGLADGKVVHQVLDVRHPERLAQRIFNQAVVVSGPEASDRQSRNDVMHLGRLSPLREFLQNFFGQAVAGPRSEEHTSELQSLMRISYAVFCLKKKKKKTKAKKTTDIHNDSKQH